MKQNRKAKHEYSYDIGWITAVERSTAVSTTQSAGGSGGLGGTGATLGATGTARAAKLRPAPANSDVGLRYGDEKLWEQWLTAPGAQTFDEWLPTIYKAATCWECKTEWYVPIQSTCLLCEPCRAGTPISSGQTRIITEPSVSAACWQVAVELTKAAAIGVGCGAAVIWLLQWILR